MLTISGKAAAQGTGNTGGFMPEMNITQPVSFKAAATQNIAQAVTAVIEKQNGLSESKIGKRIRKKKDPILIPYSLNKKSFSYC